MLENRVTEEEEEEEEEVLSKYLERVDTWLKGRVREESVCWPRVLCPLCNASRHIYCFDCCELLIPKSDLPESLRNGTLKLPFELDILLADRRASSTGVQLATLFRYASPNSPAAVVRLFDQEKNESIPDYLHDNGESSPIDTYVLFPGSKSVPISSLKQQRSQNNKKLRLVVLDCRWKGYSRIMEPLMGLPQVHLDDPPKKSYYWRWHNAGPGCLSSAEAIFWAAWQLESKTAWLEIMWLFAIQRSVIQQKFYLEKEERTIPHLPFTEVAKQQARELRKIHDDRHRQINLERPPKS